MLSEVCLRRLEWKCSLKGKVWSGYGVIGSIFSACFFSAKNTLGPAFSLFHRGFVPDAVSMLQWCRGKNSGLHNLWGSASIAWQDILDHMIGNNCTSRAGAIGTMALIKWDEKETTFGTVLVHLGHQCMLLKYWNLCFSADRAYKKRH